MKAKATRRLQIDPVSATTGQPSLSASYDLNARLHAQRGGLDYHNAKTAALDLVQKANDAHPIPYVLLSEKGSVQFLNSAAAQLLDRSRDATLLKAFHRFVHRDDVPAFFRHLQSVLASSVPVSTALRLASGKKTELISHQIKNSQGGRELPTLILADHESPLADWFLLERNRHHHLIDGIRAIVWKASLPFRFTFVNESAEKILGYPAHAWIDDPGFWARHILAEDRERVVQMRSRAMKSPEDYSLEYRMVAADRRVVWFQERVCVHLSPTGQPTLFGVMTDITQIKTAQEKLSSYSGRLHHEIQDRTSSLEQSIHGMETFCYGISHTLRAPLRSIQSFLELLMTEITPDLSDNTRDYARRIITSAAQMDQLVKDLLEFGSLNCVRPHFETINLKAVVENALDQLKHKIDLHDARIKVPHRCPNVIADGALLTRVLFHLLHNAVKFMPAGVKPTVTMSAMLIERFPAVLRITIRDNGIGIHKEHHPKIFGLFEQLHPEEYPGTGLGLAYARRAAEIMKGTVGFDSNPGRGSAFWIELPAA